jgi:hypothetical protein
MEWWIVLLAGLIVYAVGRLLVAAYFRAKYSYVQAITRIEGDEKDVEA